MGRGAFLSKSFLQKLVEVGGEQCPSENYEKSLPSGVHILTNHVKESTDSHVDCNPTTLNRIENDDGVVFLNTNPDARFIVGDEEFPVEEGALIMFPGGSVPHHIKMKEGDDDGFVHMLGPFEVGGSHGVVCYFSRKLGQCQCGSCWAYSPTQDQAPTDSVQAVFKISSRRRQLEAVVMNKALPTPQLLNKMGQ